MDFYYHLKVPSPYDFISSCRISSKSVPKFLSYLDFLRIFYPCDLDLWHLSVIIKLVLVLLQLAITPPDLEGGGFATMFFWKFRPYAITIGCQRRNGWSSWEQQYLEKVTRFLRLKKGVGEENRKLLGE